MKAPRPDIDPEQYIAGSIDVDLSSLPDGKWLVYAGDDGLQVFVHVQSRKATGWSATRELETVTFPPKKDGAAAMRSCQGRGYVCAALGDGKYVCFCA
jgi:hypothetical protein